MTKFDSKYLHGASAAALALALLAAAPAARAADYDVGSIHISQPWSRATPKGASAAAGYMTITNKGAAPDRRQLCVERRRRRRCQIHTMSMAGMA